ncbi:alpha/beta fold hydrolase [Umezawaea tangerina]|uniref:Pimeloyl-ACP methyl ester carboxylesterase n=1 Tax=Umezawaea tangerina TaxID=84725 RepID=A0A2T0SXZ3_9PSEU|nr:alpha/beta hydrolase [Umezawaea tangerina]PRY38260.1 pimeloyl-ACP methyl ester carboxylesterase [Umezawaea tangerina]
MTLNHQNTKRYRGLAGAIAILLCLLGCAFSPDTTGAADAFDAATRDDAAFNRQFRHEFADVDGVRMHYVTGGTGEPLVLLHGWPQSWYEWRGIMPDLARNYTVYALDLPGLGDSTGSPTGYDKATLARYVHALLADNLGLDHIRLVGHDLGAGVGIQYALQYPDQVVRYAHLDYPVPGPALSAADYRKFSWHMAFHTQPRIPEMLVDDDVHDYLSAFYPQVAYQGTAFGGTNTQSPFTPAQVDEYARTYRRPQVLTGGFDLYRTLDQDQKDNTSASPTTVPTLLLTAEGTLASTTPTLAPLTTNLRRTTEIPHSGHWLPEENPTAVTTELLTFFAAP